MSKIRHIIFDLGGVLINLNTESIEKRFQNILGHDFSTLLSDLTTQEIFNKFEVGAFSEEKFFTFFTQASKINREEAIAAWNSILLAFPFHRLELLRSLQKDYDIYLLSNTNITHVQKIEADLLKNYGIADFRGTFFKKGYYSFEVGLRKPDPQIFQYVLENAQLDPAETLFIDDGKANIESAAKLGIQTILHDPTMEIAPVLADFLAKAQLIS